MKDYKNIILIPNYLDHPHIALIELHRPKQLNALSSELMEELVHALMRLEDDNNCRTVILTGNSKAFAAGADIAQMVEASPIDQIVENRFRSWKQISFFTKPLIAAVDGFALGGGCELAMSCDFIIASDKAQFGQPEIKIGTTPGAGGTQRLTHAMGKSLAMYYILTGEMFDAKTALQYGLVAKVVPNETLLQETFEVAKLIAAKAPIALRLIKESINAHLEMPLKEGLEFERRNFFLTFSSLDQKEGMRAFLEKREPNYQGR